MQLIVECVLSTCKALGQIASTAKIKEIMDFRMQLFNIYLYKYSAKHSEEFLLLSCDPICVQMFLFVSEPKGTDILCLQTFNLKNQVLQSIK